MASSSFFNSTGGYTINIYNPDAPTSSHHTSNQHICPISQPLSSYLEAIKFNSSGHYQQALKSLNHAFIIVSRDSPVDSEEKNQYLLLKILIELAKATLGLSRYEDSQRYLTESVNLLTKTSKIMPPEKEQFLAEIEFISGNIQLERHCFNSALKSFRKALALFEGLKIDKPYQISMCYRRIGEVLLEQKLFTEASGYFQIAINLLRNRPNLDHNELLEVIRILNRTGLLYSVMQRYNEAEQIYQESLRTLKETFGSEHIEISWTFHHLGVMYIRLCRYSDAKIMLENAYNLLQGLYGERHSILARVTIEMGTLLMDQEKIEEGELYMKKGLDLAVSIFNENDPILAIYHLKLGYFYLEQEKGTRAEDHFKQVLKLYKGAYGENDGLTAIGYHTLAVTYQELGREKEARENYKKDLELCKKYYGETHPEVSKSFYWLATLEWINGKYEEALNCLKKCIEIDENFFGEESPQLAIDYQELARVLIDSEQIEKAMVFYEKSTKIDEEYFGKDHPRTSRGYFLAGIGLCDAGKYKESRKNLEKSLNIITKNNKEGEFQARRIYHAIGNVYNSEGKYSEALRFYAKALNIWQDNEKNEELLRNIGDVCYNQDKFQKALVMYQRALDTAIKFKGHRHYSVGVLHTNIGNCFGWMKSEEIEALKSLHKGIKILLQAPYKDEVILLDNFYSRGDVMRRIKGTEESISAMKKALLVCRKSEKEKVNELDKRIQDLEKRKAMYDRNISEDF